MTNRNFKSALDKVLKNIQNRLSKINETVKLAKKVVKQKGTIREKNINKLKVYIRFLNTQAVKFKELIEEIHELEPNITDKYYLRLLSTYDDLYKKKRKIYNKKYTELEKLCNKIEELEDLLV